MADLEVAERFGRDTAKHEMTVLHDDGLYRHLRFQRVTTDVKTGKRKRSGSYWFDLITWPGCLAVNGDCGSFLFSRETDMFPFFRSGYVNPGYWAEKVRSRDTSGFRTYSSELFRQFVTEYAAESAEEWPGLPEAVERDIFSDQAAYDTEHEEGAREALRDFAFGDTWTVSCRCGLTAKGMDWPAADTWRTSHITAANTTAMHSSKVGSVEGFRFTDTWEWDLTDFDWQFLWCCHAIQWGIGQYDKARASDEAAAYRENADREKTGA